MVVKNTPKAVLVVVFCWLHFALSKSLADPVLRHTSGLQGVEANAGMVAIGPFGSLEWSYCFSSNWQAKAGLGGVWIKKNEAVYKAIFTQPVLLRTLVSNHRNFFLNALLGTNLVCESVKKGYQFNVGMALGGELEVFLIHRLAFLCSGGYRLFFLKSPYGRSDYFLGAGLRFSF